MHGYECKYASAETSHFALTQFDQAPDGLEPIEGADAVAYFTTPAVDNDNEIVLPQGGDLARYRKNPVVLLNHEYGQAGSYYPLPIGRAMKIEVTSKGVLGHIAFAWGTDMGREVGTLVEEGILKGVSIGFRPTSTSRLAPEEAKSRKDWQAAYDQTRGGVLVHRRWRLHEVSVVSIPCNEDALIARYRSRSEPIPKWIRVTSMEAKAMQGYRRKGVSVPSGLPMLTPLSPEKVKAQANARIEKMLRFVEKDLASHQGER